MTQRTGYMAAAVRMQRDRERYLREQARSQAAADRARQQAQRSAERAASADAKQRAAMYSAARSEDTDALSAELEARLRDLHGILAATLAKDDYIELESLKEPLRVPAFVAGPLGQPALAPGPAQFTPQPASAWPLMRFD